MQTFAGRFALVCAATLSVLGGSACFADERLVMPYSCQSRGDNVWLVPGPDQSYRILGTVDHQLYTACPLKKPEVCQSWLLHKFEVDCAGARVSWLSVVDAMTKWSSNRLWVSDGSLHVKIRTRRARVERRPCLTLHFQYGPWVYAVHSPCGRNHSLDSVAVSLPPGFAPTSGLPARLVSVAEPNAVPTEASASAGLAAYVDPSTEPHATPSRIIRETTGTALKGGDHATSSVAEPTPDASAPEQGTESTSSIEPFNPQSGHKLSFQDAWLVLAGLSLASVVLLLWIKPLRHKGDLVLLNRRVMWQARDAFGDAAVAPADVTKKFDGNDDWLPSTHIDALLLLGAGPETAKEALKKSVNRLRQSWHPDLARTDEDRRVRERRLKQINVAWEIITGKRQ